MEPHQDFGITRKIRPGEVLCDANDIEDGSARLFVICFDDGEEIEFFILRLGNELRAYVNRCHHQDMPLRWDSEGSFLTKDRKRIQCSVHGATFDLMTGRALSGPALPDGCLIKVPFLFQDGKIVLPPSD